MATLNIFISITTEKFSEKCEKLYRDRGHQVILSTLGHGTANSKLFDYLSLETSEKLVQFIPVDEKEGTSLIKEFRRAVHYEQRGSGIAFVIPLSSVSGKTVMEYMMGAQDKKPTKEIKTDEKKQASFRYDLIIAVANQGYTEEVMQAARKAGAGGGTVIHAKGTASQYMEKFFGITLSDEKEIILIVTKNFERDKIMDAIKQGAGVSSDAHTILFSLPVENVAGIASYE